MSEITVKRSYVIEILKAVIFAFVVTLILILLAALAIKIFSLPTDTISIINQVIKCVSLLLSALICFKLPNNGYLRGMILGGLYFAFTYVVFSLLNGSFVLSLSELNNFTLSVVSGLISGILAVNLRK